MSSEIVKKFVEKLEQYYERKSVVPIGDNLVFSGMMLKIFPNGQGEIIIDTTCNKEILDKFCPEFRLLKQIYGAGEIIIEFDNVEELERILES